MKNQDNWVSASIKCDLCNYEWISVHHIETERLECPNCENFTIYD